MPEAGVLGKNIRKYRKRKGMTQRELAEALFLTAQTVSKWEKGTAYPDLVNFCRLSEMLAVSPDQMLEEERFDTAKAMIAIDGGGTKTEFMLFLENGEIRSRFVLSGTNPNVCGMQEACRVLGQGIDILMSSAAEISGIFAGIAGSSSGKNSLSLQEYLCKRYPNIPCEVGSDILNVMNSVRGWKKCIAAICGTGSVVYGHDQKQLHRAGGWGYLFDSAGSGYDIGKNALERCMRYESGLADSSLLTEKVYRRIGNKVLDHLDIVYSRGNEYIASFAPLVFEAYLEGDSAAEEILQKTIDGISVLIRHVHERYDCGNTLILAGGLTAYRDVFIKMLTPRLWKGAEILFPALPPIYGACLCAMQNFGPASYDQQKFDANFTADYKMFSGTGEGEKAK